MGKLHTLRRAIERAPERWYLEGETGRKRAYGAYLDRSGYGWGKTPKWEPIRYGRGWHSRPYQDFVRSVLRGFRIANVS